MINMKTIITLLIELIAILALSIDVASAGACTPESGLITANTQNFILIAGAGLTFAGGVNSTVLSGDVASYPLATDFASNSKVILYGVNYLNGSVAQTAKADVLTAYATAASKNPRLAIVADLGGTTVTPGIYEAPSSIMNSGTLTLDGQGNPAASFVFIAASTLTTATGSSIVLANGTQACHVFWLVGSSATLGTNSIFFGTIIAQISISLLTGANVTGRFLCDSAITMDSNRVSLPSCTSSLALLPNDCVGVVATVVATNGPASPPQIASIQPAATLVTQIVTTNQPMATAAPVVSSAIPVTASTTVKSFANTRQVSVLVASSLIWLMPAA